jgi:hypothetical protein
MIINLFFMLFMFRLVKDFLVIFYVSFLELKVIQVGLFFFAQLGDESILLDFRSSALVFVRNFAFKSVRQAAI